MPRGFVNPDFPCQKLSPAWAGHFPWVREGATASAQSRSVVPAALRRRGGTTSGRFGHLEMDPSSLWSQSQHHGVEMGSQPRGGKCWVSPTSSCSCSRAFSRDVWVGAGHQGEGAQPGTAPHPQTLPQASGASSLLPSWVLLFRWCFVSHITDVTSRRHRSAEMDLMSLCFLQLRKTSERLSLQHPEEPAGCSATASVPTGGQRTAKGAESKSRASETWGQHPGHSRTPLSSPDPATSHPPHRTRQVSPCCASHCSDSTRERGTGGTGAVPPHL